MNLSKFKVSWNKLTTNISENRLIFSSFTATITVLPWMQVNTIQSFSNTLKSKTPNEETSKENVFIMLQLVNALKNLQAQGIEELPVSLNSFVLCKDMEKDFYQKLFVLQGLVFLYQNIAIFPYVFFIHRWYFAGSQRNYRTRMRS